MYFSASGMNFATCSAVPCDKMGFIKAPMWRINGWLSGIAALEQTGIMTLFCLRDEGKVTPETKYSS